MPSLSPVSESSETLTAHAELEPRAGFWPGSALYEAPYPFPGPTSYPGAFTGESLTPLTEGSETLTAMTEA